jgi:hypothetical protein
VKSKARIFGKIAWKPTVEAAPSRQTGVQGMFDKGWNNYNLYSRNRLKRLNVIILISSHLRSTSFIHLKLFLPETQALLYAQNVPRISRGSYISRICSAGDRKQLNGNLMASKRVPRLLIRYKPRALVKLCMNHEHLNLNPKYVTVYLLIGVVRWNTVISKSPSKCTVSIFLHFMYYIRY